MDGLPARADVVVVGGGLAGAVVATLLAAQGHDVVVLESQEREALDVGTGILLQPNGLSVLYGLGMRDALQEVSVEHRSVPIRDERGSLITSGVMPDWGSGFDHALALSRPTLQHLLWSTASGRGVEVRFGHRVTSIDTSAGSVEVETDSEVGKISADLVVGADGIGSIVRRTGEFGDRGVRGGHRVIRMVVDGASNVSGGEYWTSLGLFGASPVGDGKTYAYASANDPEVEAAVRCGDVAGLVRLWSEALPVAAPLLVEVRSMDQVLYNEVGTVHCRTFVDGRAVLIGDAAHAMAPNLGQGANSAFVDAAVLVREIVRADHLDAGLEAYERLRRRAVTGVQRRSSMLATVSHVGNAGVRRVRDTGFRLLGRPRIVERQIRSTQQVDPVALYDDVRRLCP